MAVNPVPSSYVPGKQSLLLSLADKSSADPCPLRIDVHENTETNTVTTTFELPGLAKEDVNIDVHNNVLTVSGESKTSTERDENGYAVRERRFGKFSRSIPLPQGIKVWISRSLTSRVTAMLSAGQIGGEHQGNNGERRADRYVPEDDARDGAEEDRNLVDIFADVLGIVWVRTWSTRGGSFCLL